MGQQRWAELVSCKQSLGLKEVCRVRVPFLQQPRCSTSALAYWMWRYPPQQNVLHCAIEQRLSLSHWWTANFFLVLWMWRGGDELFMGCWFFFAFKGTFSIAEYAPLNRVWTESRGMFVHSLCHILTVLMDSVEWFWSNVSLKGRAIEFLSWVHFWITGFFTTE